MLAISKQPTGFSYKTINKKIYDQKKCQSLCFCSQKIMWDSDHENVENVNGPLKICDYCKKQHEYCLNYHSENNFSSWANIMEFFLK